jgi:uncharacterized protein
VTSLDSLWTKGYAQLGTLLQPAECRAIRALYEDPGLFRSRIDMKRYRFGSGEYQYFRYPLPAAVHELREQLYRVLAPVAVEWMAALNKPAAFPGELGAFLDECHAAGQTRPTPLLLKYQAGDYNCLHQDLYGEIFFPFQVVFGLSDPVAEYTGGELLLIEQQPRAQSVGHAIRLGLGEAVVITTRWRPAKGARGYYRTNFRHGVSPVLTGERYTLGILFHDAQ